MKNLLLTLLISLPLIATAAEKVTGDLQKAYDGKARYCRAEKDTKKIWPAYMIYSPVMSATDTEFALTVTYRRVKCVEVGGVVQWIDSLVGDAIEYDTKVGGKDSHIRLWGVDPELVWTNRSSNLLGKIPLRSGFANSDLDFKASLVDVLGTDGHDRLKRSGEVQFRIHLFERAISKYTIDGGAEQNLGLRGGGVFILNGRIETTPFGYRVSLIED